MDVATYILEMIDAREALAFERSKTPPSKREMEWAEERYQAAIRYANEAIDERIAALAGVAVREYGE